jgi:hypothetical protein
MKIHKMSKILIITTIVLKSITESLTYYLKTDPIKKKCLLIVIIPRFNPLTPKILKITINLSKNVMQVWLTMGSTKSTCKRRTTLGMIFLMHLIFTSILLRYQLIIQKQNQSMKIMISSSHLWKLLIKTIKNKLIIIAWSTISMIIKVMKKTLILTN